MSKAASSLEQLCNLREVRSLRKMQDSSCIVQLLDAIFIHGIGSFLVFELMDCDLLAFLRSYQKRQMVIPEEIVSRIMYRTICALAKIHSAGYFHRDLKPENILINRREGVAKLCDFGLVRDMRSTSPLTPYIATRWYRSPEMLLESGDYGPPVDMWAVGCIMIEILQCRPIFEGKDNSETFQQIVEKLGGFDRNSAGSLGGGVWNRGIHQLNQHQKFIPLYEKAASRFCRTSMSGLTDHIQRRMSPEAVDMIARLLTFDPDRRLNAFDALNHPFFAKARALEPECAHILRPAACPVSINKRLLSVPGVVPPVNAPEQIVVQSLAPPSKPARPLAGPTISTVSTMMPSSACSSSAGSPVSQYKRSPAPPSPAAPPAQILSPGGPSLSCLSSSYLSSVSSSATNSLRQVAAGVLSQTSSAIPQVPTLSRRLSNPLPVTTSAMSIQPPASRIAPRLLPPLSSSVPSAPSRPQVLRTGTTLQAPHIPNRPIIGVSKSINPSYSAHSLEASALSASASVPCVRRNNPQVRAYMNGIYDGMLVSKTLQMPEMRIENGQQETNHGYSSNEAYSTQIHSKSLYEDHNKNVPLQQSYLHHHHNINCHPNHSLVGDCDLA
eukprot:GDKJ01035525.1.p1 GENE.GDKJ01035525.1~~GDKJ01035525.1.p1  ORF type:complete len:668 (-),score=136.68 GDKJ01035525.1:759-2591(-)